MGRHPVALREREDRRPVESSGSTEVEVLDDRIAAQLRRLQASGQAAVLTIGGLAVDEQAQAYLEAELGIGR